MPLYPNGSMQATGLSGKVILVDELDEAMRAARLVLVSSAKPTPKRKPKRATKKNDQNGTRVGETAEGRP